MFAEVGPGHDQVLWKAPHPCTQNASWSFRRWTWSNISLLQSHIWGRGLTSLPQPEGCSLLSLFWQEHQPLPSAPYPYPSTSPAVPSHGHIPCQAGDAGSALGLHSLGAWHHGTLLLNHSSAHVCQERPRQGWGWAGHCAWCSRWGSPGLSLWKNSKGPKPWRAPPQEVHKLLSPLQEMDVACLWTLPTESWTTAPLTHPPWQAPGQPFPGHPHSQGMCTGRREWLPCSWDLAEVSSHAWC